MYKKMQPFVLRSKRLEDSKKVFKKLNLFRSHLAYHFSCKFELRIEYRVFWLPPSNYLAIVFVVSYKYFFKYFELN